MPDQVFRIGDQTYRFPEGTPPEEIQAALASLTEEPKPTYSAGEFAQNVKRSGGEFFSGALDAATHPIDTLANVGKLGVGAGELLIPGEQGDEPRARAVGKYYKDRYSHPLDTAWNDPVGTLADASMVVGGAGGVLKGAGMVPKLSSLARVGEVLSTAGDLTNPTRAVTLPAKLAMQEAGLYPIMATTRGTKATHEDFGGRRAIAKTIQDEGLLTGTGGPSITSGAAKTESARETADKIMRDAAAAGTPGLSVGGVARGVRSDVQPIIARRTALGMPDATGDLTDRLTKFRAQHPTGEIPLGDVRDLTREAQDVAYEMGKENLTIPKETSGAFARQMRSHAETAVPAVGPANARTQRLLGATRLIDESEPGVLSSQALPFLAGSTTYGASRDPMVALQAAIAARAAGSPTLGRAAGIALGKGGKILDPYLARLALLQQLGIAGDASFEPR